MPLEPIRTIACLPQTTRGRPIVLGAHPKGETFLYCHDKNVIIRKIDDPKENDIYSEHATQASVAKYSPTGFYIASGDKSGKVRLWDTVNPEHILKAEYQPISGTIKDIDWDCESKRLVVAGEGRTSYTAAFSFDTGTSLGDMRGHTKPANSVAYKPNRPFRIASGGEDFSVAFYHGPPFKCESNHNEHKNFVNMVRYTPNGEMFVSASADGRILTYDGKTGEPTGEFGNPAHKAGIYGVSFSNDGKKMVSASADKTVKIWATDGDCKEPLAMYAVGAAVNDMQVSCLWPRPDTIITVSLSGCIHFFTPDALTDGPRLTIRGHNKPISAFVQPPDGGPMNLMTASSEGQIVGWDLESGQASFVTGDCHTSQVQAMAIDGSGQLISVGFDDTLRITDMEQMKIGTAPARKLDSQPKSIAARGDLVVVGCLKKVLLINKGADFASITVSYEPICVAISVDGSVVAIGGDDDKIHLHKVGQSDEMTTIATTGPVLSLAFSNDGQRLAATDGGRKVHLINTSDWSSYADFGYHTARVTCCAWSPDSSKLATGSLDTNIMVIPADGSRSREMFKGAHPKSQVNGIAWLDNSRLVTAGQDSVIRLWRLS